MASLGWMAIGASITAVLAEVLILCYRQTTRKVPINYFILVIFTACQSFVLSYLSTSYSLESCATSIGITIIVLVALTFYAFYTSHDFTVKRTLILLACIAGASAAAFNSQFSYEQWW